MGRLFYVIGASGCGKDSLLREVRGLLQGQPLFFAHRYITRPRGPAGGEEHVAVTPAEFLALRAAGAFCLHWQSHGLMYGIGREVELWRQAGPSVVVNGSRDYLPEALGRSPGLVPVLVRADRAVVAGRLAARGRETPAEIAARLERGSRLDREIAAAFPDIPVIDNSGRLADAARSFAQLLRGHAPAPAGASLHRRG